MFEQNGDATRLPVKASDSRPGQQSMPHASLLRPLWWNPDCHRKRHPLPERNFNARSTSCWPGRATLHRASWVPLRPDGCVASRHRIPLQPSRPHHASGRTT